MFIKYTSIKDMGVKTNRQSKDVIFVVSKNTSLRRAARNVFRPNKLGDYSVVPVKNLETLNYRLSHNKGKFHIFLDLKRVPENTNLPSLIIKLKKRKNVSSLTVVGSLNGKSCLDVGADNHIDGSPRNQEHLGIELRSCLNNTLEWQRSVSSSCGSHCLSTIIHSDRKKEITDRNKNSYLLRNIHLVTLELDDGRSIDAILKTTSSDEARIYDLLKPLQGRRLPIVYGELRSRGWLCLELIGANNFGEVSTNHLEARLTRIKDLDKLTKSISSLMADFFYDSAVQFSSLCKRTGFSSDMRSPSEQYWKRLGAHIKKEGIRHYDGQPLGVRVMDRQYMVDRFVNDGGLILDYLWGDNAQTKKEGFERKVRRASKSDFFNWTEICEGIVHLDSTLLNILFSNSTNHRERLIDFNRGIGYGGILYCATPLCFPHFVLFGDDKSNGFGMSQRTVIQESFFKALYDKLLNRIVNERASIPQFDLVNGEIMEESMPYFGGSQVLKFLSYVTRQDNMKYTPVTDSFETYIKRWFDTLWAFNIDAKSRNIDDRSIAVVDFVEEELVGGFYQNNPHLKDNHSSFP